MGSEEKRFWDLYSETQLAVNRWIGFPSALLSMACSFILLIHIVTRPKSASSTARKRKDDRNQASYDRLVAGLSVSDIISSATFLANIIDEGTSRAGSLACNVTAFLMVWSTSTSVLYNVSLSLYFMMIVRFSVKVETVVTWELIFRTISIGLPWLVCMLALFVQALNPLPHQHGCWIGQHKCDKSVLGGDDACETRGETWGWILFETVNIILYISFALMAVTNTIMFCHVRGIEGRMRRYDFAPSPSSSANNQSVTTTTSSMAAAASPEQAQQPQRQARKLATQSILFLSGFCLTYIFAVIAALAHNGVGTNWFFAITLLQNVTFPLQGFLDMFVYFRPRYLQRRRKFSSEKLSVSLRRTFFHCEELAVPETDSE